jgi:hypothetical protein
MEGIGFTDVRLYGDLEGGDYGTSAGRLIAVGRKPRRAKRNATGGHGGPPSTV